MGKSEKRTRNQPAADSRNTGWIRPLTFLVIAILVIKVAVFAAAWFGMTRREPDRAGYLGDYHHYREDPRVTRGGAGTLAESFSAADAQWYASIAEQGYPARDQFSDAGCSESLRLTSRCENYLAWAFFPLWPLIMRGLLLLFRDPFLAGFIASNLLSLAAGAVLFLYLRRHCGNSTAVAAVALLFASPFAMFLEAPFTESLFLFLVACLFLATDLRAWPLAGLSLALLSVTRPNGIAVGIVPLVYILGDLARTRRFVWRDALRWCWCGLALIPYGAWLAFNNAKTGDSLFFYTVQERWFSGGLGLENLWNNLSLTFHFTEIPWHEFHFSRIDILTMLVSLALLLLGFRKLKPAETAYAAVILVVPLISKDLLSFSRYALPAWPLFLTLSRISGWPSRRWAFAVLFAAFLIGELVLTLRFVAWQWVG